MGSRQAGVPGEGGTSANFMGNIIYSNIGIANNMPFAAAMALVLTVIPVIIAARVAGAGAITRSAREVQVRN